MDLIRRTRDVIGEDFNWVYLELAGIRDAEPRDYLVYTFSPYSRSCIINIVHVKSLIHSAATEYTSEEAFPSRACFPLFTPRISDVLYRCG